MAKIVCGKCGVGIASVLSGALCGLLARSLCVSCSHPAYRGSVA